MNLSYGELLIARRRSAPTLLVTQFALSPLVALGAGDPSSASRVSWLVYQLLLIAAGAAHRRGPRARGRQHPRDLRPAVRRAGRDARVLFGGGYYSYEFLSVPVDVLGATSRGEPPARARLRGWSSGSRCTCCSRARAPARRSARSPSRPTSRRWWASTCGACRRSRSAGRRAGRRRRRAGQHVPAVLGAAMGVVFTMKALVVVIMGGVGNLVGCLVAGLMLGYRRDAGRALRRSGPDAGRELRAVPGWCCSCGRPGLFGRAAR